MFTRRCSLIAYKLEQNPVAQPRKHLRSHVILTYTWIMLVSLCINYQFKKIFGLDYYSLLFGSFLFFFYLFFRFVLLPQLPYSLHAINGYLCTAFHNSDYRKKRRFIRIHFFSLDKLIRRRLIVFSRNFCSNLNQK